MMKAHQTPEAIFGKCLLDGTLEGAGLSSYIEMSHKCPLVYVFNIIDMSKHLKSAEVEAPPLARLAANRSWTHPCSPLSLLQLLVSSFSPQSLSTSLAHCPLSLSCALSPPPPSISRESKRTRQTEQKKKRKKKEEEKKKQTEENS